MTKLEEIEGVGPAYAEKLRAAGVASVGDLLAQGGTRDGRKRIATAAGVSPDLVLEWVNHADLMRINGVGSEFADLLEAAGVDSVPELAGRNAGNLTAALAATNAAKKLVRRLPAESEVTRWIAQAAAMERAVHH